MGYLKMRAVDENGDWEFGKGMQSYASIPLSAGLNVKTRLQSFMYDCFFDLTSGIDWISLLTEPSKWAADLIELNVRQCIIRSLYVREITSLDIVKDSEKRTMTITYTIQTIFDEPYSDTVMIGGFNA